MKHKYHTWRRIPAISIARKNTFYCNHPSCFQKAQLHTLNKKFAECPNCGVTFVVDISTITPEMEGINCPKCLGVEPNQETTLFEKMKEETTEFLLSNFKTVQTELGKLQAELEQREKASLRLEQKLESQKERLTALVDSHRKTFTRRRHELKDIEEFLLQREKDVKGKEASDALNDEVIADAVLALFKEVEELKKEEPKNECDGPSTN